MSVAGCWLVKLESVFQCWCIRELIVTWRLLINITPSVGRTLTIIPTDSTPQQGISTSHLASNTFIEITPPNHCPPATTDNKLNWKTSWRCWHFKTYLSDMFWNVYFAHQGKMKTGTFFQSFLPPVKAICCDLSSRGQELSEGIWQGSVKDWPPGLCQAENNLWFPVYFWLCV